MTFSHRRSLDAKRGEHTGAETVSCGATVRGGDAATVQYDGATVMVRSRSTVEPGGHQIEDQQTLAPFGLDSRTFAPSSRRTVPFRL